MTTAAQGRNIGNMTGQVEIFDHASALNHSSVPYINTTLKELNYSKDTKGSNNPYQVHLDEAVEKDFNKKSNFSSFRELSWRKDSGSPLNEKTPSYVNTT
jgi:hypothetical protein